MLKIRRVGRIQPMITVPFYHQNPYLYQKLTKGHIIEVPEDVFPKLTGVEIVNEEDKTETFTAVSSRSKKKKPESRFSKLREEKLSIGEEIRIEVTEIDDDSSMGD